MSTAAVPAQTAATPTASLASVPANDQGGRRSGEDSSAFSSVLQELTASETSSASPAPQIPNQRGKGGNQKSSVDDADASARDDATQSSDAKPQPTFDATAAIAAMIALQGNGAAIASAPAIQSVVPANDSDTADSAVKLIAARLNKQTAAARENGLVMPSDASPTTPEPISDAAPSVAVHVQQARTFLGVDNVAEATKAKVDSQPPVQVEAKAESAPAAADSGSKPNVYHPSGGGASSFANFAKQNDDAASGRQEHRGGDDALVDKSALAADVQTAAAGAIGTAPIEIDQLPDVIANQAQALVAQSAPTASTGAGSANPVKELDVSLNPSDLGSLTVKMRIANGNLSVVIETEKSSTAKMIESERQAIVDRLGSADQPIASVVIKASDNAPTQGGNSNGSGSATPQHADAQNGSNNGSGAQTRSSPGRDDQSRTRPTETVENEASGRISTGDLFV